MKFKTSLYLLLGAIFCSCSAGQQKNWWEFGLSDGVLDETALFFLGMAWYQASDVGEVLESISRVNATDIWSWTMEWRKTAERLEKLGDEQANEGHALSAGQAYLRAATYYRSSLHRHPDPFHEEVPELTRRAVDNFERFLSFTKYPCKSVKIPYENTTLPGYLCLNPSVDPGNPAPLILFNEGKDGWAEDGKFVVDEALKRGYHALLWDGPGMGKTIRLQGLPFRHDWEAVVSPVIDYLTEIPEVDENRLAMITLSLGGFLGPRAAIFEHRLKALVANSGVLSWYKVYENELGSIDPNLVTLMNTDRAAFEAAIQQMMVYSDFLQWGIIDSMWHHGVDTPSALMDEISLYNIDGMVGNFTTATLIIDAEEEERAQAKEMYDQLPETINKKYIYFTSEEAAQFHVQPGATGLLSARTFDWLDSVLNDGESPQPDTNVGSSPKSSGAFSKRKLYGFVASFFAVAGFALA